MISFINVIICIAIAVRLFLFQRGQSQYKLVYALLAWGLLCSSAAVAILSIFNKIIPAEIAQTIMNIFVLICMLKTKGNVTQFIYHLFWQPKTTTPRQNKKVKIS